MTSIESLRQHLGRLTYGRGVVAGDLRVIPIFGPARGPRAVSLPEAMRRGLARVEEVTPRARVRRLRITNGGKRPLLLFDGEELVGARQNRLVNVTILVAAGVTADIPVSCIEQRRWDDEGRPFSTRQRIVPSSMRGTKTARLTRGAGGRDAVGARQRLRSRWTAAHDADQRTVWAEVERCAMRSGVHTVTGALTDVLDRWDAELDRFDEAIPRYRGQVGMLVYVRGALIGCDVMGRPEVYGAVHGRLVRSYAIDILTGAAARRRGSAGRRWARDITDADDPRDVLDRLTHGFWTMVASPGLGTEIRIHDGGPGLEVDAAPGTSAIALMVGGALVHLAAFVDPAEA